MTHQLFLGDPSAVAGAAVGGTLTLEGEEGRHAATVVRLRAGERYWVADGAGRRALCAAEAVERTWVRGRVEQVETSPPRARASSSCRRWPRATATSRRSRRPPSWVSTRSCPGRPSARVVVWRGERAAKSLAKWAAVVARATKQSRRARLPVTSSAVGLPALVSRVEASALTLVLHEDATLALTSVALPEAGDVLARRRPRGRHHRARARGADRGRRPAGAAGHDDPALLLGRSGSPRGAERRRPLALTPHPAGRHTGSGDGGSGAALRGGGP